MRINNMLSKINRTGLSLVITLSILFVPISASALPVPSSLYFGTASSKASCDALNSLNSSQSCGSDSSTTVTSLLGSIINILSIIIGFASVIMIIISGFRFITSGGEASKVAASKTALIYALVGLAIVALSQALVHFALETATNAVTVPAKKK